MMGVTTARNILIKRCYLQAVLFFAFVSHKTTLTFFILSTLFIQTGAVATTTTTANPRSNGNNNNNNMFDSYEIPLTETRYGMVDWIDSDKTMIMLSRIGEQPTTRRGKRDHHQQISVHSDTNMMMNGRFFISDARWCKTHSVLFLTFLEVP